MARSRGVSLSVSLFALGLIACSGRHGSGSLDDKSLVSGLQVSQVALYQGLKATVMQDGAAATSPVPIVVGKAGMLRIFVQPGADWTSKQVLVHVELTQNGAPLPALEATQMITAASTEGDLATTINFNLAGETISSDLSFSVGPYEQTSGATPGPSGDTTGARYPSAGEIPLGASDTGVLKVLLVPIAYGADGSNRVPPTSDTDLAGFRQRMMQLYPVSDVQITVSTPYKWTSQVAANGAGWDQLLNAIVNKRADDSAAADVYYYGLFTPALSFASYCSQGCVLGLSPLASNPMDDGARASIGVSLPGTLADPNETFVHEIGHAHGRQHAPCMVQDPDRHYPYQDAQIGVWGYDAGTQALVDPMGTARDMMSYCTPAWISDYTYKALYDRVRMVNGTKPYAFEVPSRWQSLIVRDGSVVRGAVTTFRRPPMGSDKLIERVVGGARESLTARFYPFDHLPGGLLFVPEGEDLSALRIDGLTIQP